MEPRNFPDYVPILARDFGSGGTDFGPDSRKRECVGIKMNAQLRWLISRCWQDVDFIDASARSQAADDTLDAGICSIRHPGQDKGISNCAFSFMPTILQLSRCEALEIQAKRP
jgi:hypothetical protein